MPPRVSRAGRLCWAILFAVTLLDGLAQSSPSQAQTQRDSVSKRTRPPLPAIGPSLRSLVTFSTDEPAGTIVIRKAEKALYFVSQPDQALRYQISVGRDGFEWLGTVRVGAKKEWPEWRPPAEMRARQPELPELVPSGPYNPLGHARSICTTTVWIRFIASMAPTIPKESGLTGPRAASG